MKQLTMKREGQIRIVEGSLGYSTAQEAENPFPKLDVDPESFKQEAE
jgi:hypothetical protein